MIIMNTPEINADDPSALTHVTYWITRDRVRGALSHYVDVWLVKPVYFRLDDEDLYWVAPLDMEDRSAARFDTWTLARARREVRNGLPDHELQCLRNGPDYDSLEGLRKSPGDVVNLPEDHPLYPRADTEPGTRDDEAA